jgi:hypothetical protein
MRHVAITSVLAAALLTSAGARADIYHISFNISTSIDHVFVYADEWNGQVYAWDLFPIALGTVHAGTSSFDLGSHNVAAWAVIATYGSSGVATGINSSINPPDGLPFETVFPGYPEDVVRSNIATLYNGAYNVQQAYYLTEYVLAVEDTLKTDFPTGTLHVYTFTGAVDVGTVSVALGSVGCRGDMNCDGLINFDDIDVFVAILGGATACNSYNADVNGDGGVDFSDIDPFVALLGAGATCQ